MKKFAKWWRHRTLLGKKWKTGLVLATMLHFHDTSKNKIGLGLVSLSWNKKTSYWSGENGAKTAQMHTSLFSRTCFGRIPWKNCGGEWDKTLGRWNKSPTRQELVVTLPRDCCSQTSCHTNRLVHEGALQKKKKRITIKLKPHESTNQRKSLTLVFEVQSHQIPRRLEAGYERGELTSQWTCAEKG